MTDSYLTLEEVKAHCRITDDQDDSLLQIYIEASLDACQKHIGKYFDKGLEFSPSIKAGCLLFIGHLYENREISSPVSISEVPMTISALWSVHRDPSIH